jgi:hypothetical protein
MELVRQSNGKRTYKDLLPDGPYYTDEQNAGYLSAIHVKQGSVTMAINPTPPPKATQAATQTALPVPSDEKPHRIDSLSVVQDLDAAKNQVEQWKADTWKVVKPYWGFVMYLFTSFGFILVLAAGLLWYVASSAGNESAVNMYGVPIVGRWLLSVHQMSAGVLMMLVWVITGILLINAFMWIIYTDLPKWLMVVLWALILIFARRITNKIVPNVRVIGGRGFNPGGDLPRLG